MADHDHDITMTTRPGAQNAEAVLGIMVGDRSTSPASTSRSDGLGCVFIVHASALACRAVGDRPLSVTAKVFANSIAIAKHPAMMVPLRRSREANSRGHDRAAHDCNR
jgi:hypothetical protein